MQASTTRTSATAGAITRVGSHSVRLDHSGRLEREELFPEVTAVWRGRPVLAGMEANRYSHSSGLSEWRIHAYLGNGVRYTDTAPDMIGRGPEVTATARAAVVEACRPLVEAWLESEAYVVSRRRAFAYAAREILNDKYATPYLEQRLGPILDELEPAVRSSVLAAIDARRSLEELLEQIPPPVA